MGEASLPEGWKTSEDLQIVSVSENKRVIVFRLSGAEVQKFAEDIAGNLDYVRIDEDGIHLGGWVAAGEEASFSIYDEEKKLPIEVVRRYRRDALALFPELDQSTELGYEITLPNVLCHTLQFIIKDGDQSKEENIDLKAVRKNKKKADRARNVFVKTLRYCRTYGLKRTSQKVFFRLTGKNIDNTNEAADYELFLKKHQVTAEELERQRKTEFSYQPVFSIVIPLYKTPHDYLRELIESVMGKRILTGSSVWRTEARRKNWKIVSGNILTEIPESAIVFWDTIRGYRRIRTVPLRLPQGILSPFLIMTTF